MERKRNEENKKDGAQKKKCSGLSGSEGDMTYEEIRARIAIGACAFLYSISL